MSRIAAVSVNGPIDELPGAFEALSTSERVLVSEIRANPAAVTELLGEHGRWYAETPLRMLDSPAGAEDVLGDPVVRANVEASNLEGARRRDSEHSSRRGFLSKYRVVCIPDWLLKLQTLRPTREQLGSCIESQHDLVRLIRRRRVAPQPRPPLLEGGSIIGIRRGEQRSPRPQS